ncbi:tyrosine-type recombinase/integrase (plasmid) [Streptomyces viridifaciens]|nr:tyrosine-type recombinase/integrase [Streptomyces viridifaciens]
MNLPVLVEEVVDAELVEDDGQVLVQFALPDGGPDDPDNVLTEEAADDLADARPARTSQTYAEQWLYFARWCAANGRRPGPRTSEATMVSYLSHLRRHGGRDKTGAPVSSLRLAMAAIRDRNARAGYENWPLKKAASELIRKQAAEHARARRTPRSSPPVDAARVGQLQQGATAGVPLAQWRDLTILHLGYRTRARRSEQSAYRIDSIAFERLEDGTEQMVVGKRTSKNDHWSTGKEYTVRDPLAISVVRTYIAMLAELDQAEPEMPLLRGVTQWGELMPISASGLGMTGASVNRAFRRIVARTPGFDAPHATSHGLRAGVPADLAAQGYSPAEILVITEDWKSTSMVEKYAKAGLRRAGKDDRGRTQAALDALVVPPLDAADGR